MLLQSGESMRRTFIPLIAAAMTLCSMPAFAGPAEDAFLAKLAGSWTGGGTVTGAEEGTLACKLNFKPGATKLAFSGRCSAKGFQAPPQTISGSLSYNEKTKKYEAKGPDQTAVGVKSGNAVVFTMKIKSMGAIGNTVMKISAKSIVIDGDVVRGTSGQRYKAHMIFTK
jgi:hypothetical protein